MLARRLVILLAVGLAGCGGASRVGGDPRETRVLTLMNPVGDPAEITVYAEEVARLSDGRLRIRIVPSPHQARVDYEAAVIADVRAGRTDLGWTGSRAWGGSLRALHAPLLIDSYALERRVLASDLPARMLAELEPLGLAGIGILPGPLRRPVGLHGRLLTAHDYHGLAVGEQQSRVAEATLRALGARPVPMSITRDETGLDGVETAALSLQAGHFDGAESRVSANVNLWPRPLVVFANADLFGRLTDDERRVLRNAAAAAGPRLLAWRPRDEAEIAGNLCRSGTVTFDHAGPADLRGLHTAVKPVYDDLERDPATRTALAEITKLKREVAQPPTALPACREEEEAPGARVETRLDGTWRMDTGRGASAPEFYDENWGHWIFVFDRGRFAITQQNATSCTWGYGVYAVKGEVTTWEFTDGGGEAPNRATNKPGEKFSYRLSLYRDTATLSPVPGAISPSNFDAKPWRRIGPPTRASFSRRCPPPADALAR